MWLTLFLVAAEWNPKLLFANVHLSLSSMNANAMLLLLLTHAAWWLNWCKHGKELEMTPEFRLWTELSERGPISQSLVSGLMPPVLVSTTYHSARIRISGALSRSHCMGMISSLQVCSNTRLLPQPPFLLFQNNTAFSFLAAFSTFFMQSLNSCVQLVRQEEKSTCVSDCMVFNVLMLEVE